jgi:hypothetical protein
MIASTVNVEGALAPRSVALSLLDYCRQNDWAGYDPYDALNSRLYLALPFLHSRWPRLVLTQTLKRSPINIRPLVGIPKTQNAKAMGLFAEALLKLSDLGLLEDATEVGQIAKKIIELRSPGVPYWAWGYSFPWQTRTIVVPRGAPNLVCTTFVANSLVSLYEATERAEYLDAAISAANYIVSLFWTEGSTASFSYPLATERSRIHNANFLAAALLARICQHAANDQFLEVAFRSNRYSASRQAEDGSWPYGELPTQQWIDNFHTGYNLCALRDFGVYAETTEFDNAVRRGYQFYVDNFFREDGAAKYFNDRVYPIDVHCVAQSLITLTQLQDLHPGSLEMARRVYDWAIKHMWSRSDYFYYRVLPIGTIRTSYMRWGQAWMLLALATLLRNEAGSAQTKARATACA